MVANLNNTITIRITYLNIQEDNQQDNIGVTDR